MIKLLDQIKKISIATIVLAILGGVAFIAYPEQCQQYISLFIGAAFIVVGVAGIIVFIANRSAYLSLAMGILLLIVGIVVCALYKQITALIIIIIGIFMILSGVTDFLTSLRVLVSNKFFGFLSLLLSVATIVCGGIAVFRAYDVQPVIIRFIGVALLVYAVLDIIAFIEVKLIAKKAREAKEAEQERGRAVEISDENDIPEVSEN